MPSGKTLPKNAIFEEHFQSWKFEVNSSRHGLQIRDINKIVCCPKINEKRIGLKKKF
jgi:hypothetical protein